MKLKSRFTEMELREHFIEIYDITNDLAIYKEVPVFSRSVDLVIHEKSTLLLTAIEFKLHNWKRAISQVQKVALCFDYLYICVPKPKTTISCDKIIADCKLSGIGLYFYDSIKDIFEKTIEGIKKGIIWEVQKKQIINYLEAN